MGNEVGSSQDSPTQFPELNGVLDELVTRAAAILGNNLVGAYLQGSFALGDSDLCSDCDFLIPVAGPITAEQEAGLRGGRCNGRPTARTAVPA